VLGLGGPLPEEATSQWHGARLAVDGINASGGARLPSGGARQLELVAYDHGGHPSAAETVMERLARADGARAMLVDGSDEVGVAARRAAERLRIPTLILSAAPAGTTEQAAWSFTIAPSDRDVVVMLAEYLAAHRVERLGWLAPRTQTAGDARAVFVAEATRHGVAVVAEEEYGVGANPSPDALARLAFAGARAVVAWPRDVADAVAVARTAAEHARGVALYVGPAGATAQFLTRAGDAATGVRAAVPRLLIADQLWDGDPLTVPTRDFLARFRGRYGVSPSHEAAMAWDAARLLVGALERVGPEPAALRAAIEGTDRVYGASGELGFGPSDHAGLDGRVLVVARADGGRWVIPP
jgi:branched-chain amino acid transport system substrate-binding protein